MDSDSEEMTAFLKRVTPTNILAFATGAGRVPASGFPQSPHVKFVHDDAKTHPAANTCSCELMLFVNEKTISNAFFKYFTEALMNGAVFSTC